MEEMSKAEARNKCSATVGLLFHTVKKEMGNKLRKHDSGTSSHISKKQYKRHMASGSFKFVSCRRDFQVSAVKDVNRCFVLGTNTKLVLYRIGTFKQNASS